MACRPEPRPSTSSSRRPPRHPGRLGHPVRHHEPDHVRAAPGAHLQHALLPSYYPPGTTIFMDAAHQYQSCVFFAGYHAEFNYNGCRWRTRCSSIAR